ncbi:MAG TPA: hypothetical protein VF515_09550 [Candidatus Binatia bacterium]
MDLAAVSPLVLKKNWTKTELLDLYRGSATGKRIGTPHSDKALFRKRLDALIQTVAALIDQGSRPKPIETDARRGRGSSPSRWT